MRVHQRTLGDIDAPYSSVIAHCDKKLRDLEWHYRPKALA
jgi:hypothetical protein